MFVIYVPSDQNNPSEYNEAEIRFGPVINYVETVEIIERKDK